MARLPPPRGAMHRSLRIPDLRAGGDSPLRTSSRLAVPAICAIRRLPTRGSAPASRTPHPEFNRNRAPTTDRSSRQQIAAMSMLRSSNREKHAPEKLFDAVRLVVWFIRAIPKLPEAVQAPVMRAGIVVNVTPEDRRQLERDCGRSQRDAKARLARQNGGASFARSKTSRSLSTVSSLKPTPTQNRSSGPPIRAAFSPLSNVGSKR